MADDTLRMHVKLLAEPDAGLENLLADAQALLGPLGVTLDVGSAEDLSALPGATDFATLEVGTCGGEPGPAQARLLADERGDWSGYVPHEAPPVGVRQQLAVISRNPSVANVYARGGDNALWQRALYDGVWHPWGRHDDGGVLASAPTLGSMGPDHEHVFVRGTDGQVWQKWWNAGAGWSGWAPIGAPDVGLVEGPVTISRNSEVCNVYARGTDDALWQRAYYGGQWHAWGRHDDGGVLASVPALGSMGPEHEHVFVRGTDGQVWQKWWNGGVGWSQWIALGAPPVGFVGAPTTVSRDPQHCTLYVRGTDDALWRRSYAGGAWQEWVSHADPGTLAETPAPGVAGADVEQVFIEAVDGQVWQRWWLGPTRAREVVVFVVDRLTGRAGPSQGNAAHPGGRPGIVLGRAASGLALVRELAHLAGAPHADGAAGDALTADESAALARRPLLG